MTESSSGRSERAHSGITMFVYNEGELAPQVLHLLNWMVSPKMGGEGRKNVRTVRQVFSNEATWPLRLSWMSSGRLDEA